MFRSDNASLESADDVVDITRNGSAGINVVYWYYFDFSMFEEFRFRLSAFLWTRFSIVLAIVCFLVNGLTILVLTRKNSRYFSTSIFLVSLAVSDMFTSIFFLDGFLVSNGFIDPVYNEFDCKFRLFLPRVGKASSAVMLTVISVERAVSVKMPHKVKLIFTVKVAGLLVALVWVISIACNSLDAYLQSYETADGLISCLMKGEGVEYRVNFVVDKILIIGPWVVNLLCMVFIIKALLKNAIVKDKSNKKQVHAVTKSLLIVNIVYFLFVTPHIIYDTYILVIRNFTSTYWFLKDFYNHFNVNNILTIFTYTNNVLNFFIYFLSGSRFRKETKAFLFSCSCTQSKNKSS